MQFVKTSERYIVRLEKGESIIDELTSFCQKENITTGFFYGLGAVLSAELGYYNLKTKKYRTKKFNNPHEIVSLVGNVSIVNNKPFIHAHCVLSNENFECFGGHLKEAVVGGTCEIYLTREEIALERKYDEETGLKLLDCAVKK